MKLTRSFALALMILSTRLASAQTPVVIKAVDSATGATTDVGNATDHAIRVTQASGGAVWTFNWTQLLGAAPSATNPMPSRLTDGTTFIDPRSIRLLTASDVVTAVGTFWQATQPVSGTFWQATQPVSIATMPSTPVTGTFFQATQPVSGTVTATQATGTNLHVVVDTAPTTAVTGTFWQATQPVSGTVTANAGTNLNTSALALDATLAGAIHAEDSASVDLDKGIGALAIRQAVPANTSTTDGDYEYLRINAGRLWTSTAIDTALPAGTAVIGHVINDTGSTTAVTGNVAVTSAGLTNLDVALSTRTKPADQQHAILDSGTTVVTQATGSNLHIACDSGCGGAATFADAAAFTAGTTSITNIGALFDDTPPTAITTGKAAAPRITANRGLHVNLRSAAGAELPLPAALAANGGLKIEGVAGGVAVPTSLATLPALVAGSAVIGHVIVDTTSTTAVTQATGTNLHTVLDTTSTTAVTQATGTNLHAVLDTTSTTAVTQATAANLNATVTQLALTKGTQGANGVTTQDLKDAGRTSIMLTATVASTAVAETLITLTRSIGLAATGTCSSCAITTGKTFRIQSIVASVRHSTGSAATNVTINLRAAVAGATTTASPLQFHTMVNVPITLTNSVLFPLTLIPDGFEIASNAGTNTYGITITHPQWVTGTAVETFDLTIIGFEY